MNLPGYIILALLATSFVGSAQDESTVYAYEVDPDTGWALVQEPVRGYLNPYPIPSFPEPMYCWLLRGVFKFLD